MELDQVLGALSQALPILVTILVPVLAGVAMGAAKKLGKKFDQETQHIINIRVMELVEQGTAYAEQYARIKAKEAEQVHGSDKLFLATKYVLDEAGRLNIPELTQEVIEKKIESYLGLGALTESMLPKKEEGTDEQY